MKIESSHDLKFDDGYTEKNGKIHVQDVIFNNIVIGCLVHIQGSILAPVDMYYTINAPVEHSTMFDNVHHCEDEGRIYGVFECKSVDKYIEYVNKYRL